jgi:hypothetical protein
MVSYKLEYSIEVCILAHGPIKFRIVDTGIGWVMVASAETLEDAWRQAKIAQPRADFVLHQPNVIVCYYTKNGGSLTLHNGDRRTTRSAREEQYNYVLDELAKQPNSEDFLADLERAMRIAFPAAA